MAIRHNKLDFTEYSRKAGSARPNYSSLFQIPERSRPGVKIKKFKAAGYFALTGVILILVLQGLSYLSNAKSAQTQILGAATSAYTQLHDASRDLVNQNFRSAKDLFASAQSNIQIAQDKLSNFGLLKFLAPQGQSADHMLAGASSLAQSGDKLSQALGLFEELKVSSQGIVTDNITQKIKDNRDLLAQAKDLIDSAAKEFNSVQSIPVDYADTLTKGKQQVAELSSVLTKLIGLEDLYLGFFSAQPHTYLLVFENYDEARATGGFIGTYGVLKTESGKISHLKIASVYSLDGQIYEQVAAPGPFQPAIKRWGMRDANWFADFPTSAAKLMQFFEYGGESADGVISVTPQLFGRLLALTGPIEMSQYHVTLTPENFQQTVQFETSVDYDKTLNQPKKFLADFAPVFLNRLTNLKQTQWLDLFQALEDNLNQKQILLYSKDPAVQAKIKDLGFSGQISPTDFDYLAIINSNLGGTKTDLSIASDVKLSGKILSDGSVLNTLTISRANHALETNKDFIRILVPKDSQLVSAAGLDPYNFYESTSSGMRTDPDLAAWDRGQMNFNLYVRAESGKTEFSGWVNTQPGDTRVITISYVLPFKVTNTYSLLLQKQGGSLPFAFAGSLNIGSADVVWTSDNLENQNGLLQFNSNSAMDDFWGAVINR